MAPTTINVRELLGFFDEASEGSAGHASAIVAVAGEDLGVALVVRYLSERGAAAEVLAGSCTQGTRSGCRLDRWINVRYGDQSILYQTEIKNWSAHAIGGRRLARAASREEVQRHKRERWQCEWEGVTFRKSQVAKVLTPMRPPRSAIVEPLVCFWDAMHPTGADEPWFTTPLSGSHFSRVSVFSMSAYLRSVGDEVITMDMPNLEARRAWLERLFPSCDAV